MKNHSILLSLFMIFSVSPQAQPFSYIWARQGNAWSGNAAGQRIAPSTMGSCVTTGVVDFSSVSFDTLNILSNYNDAYIAMHNSDGSIKWGRNLGDAGYDNIFGLKTDSTGNIYIAGAFQSGFIQMDSIQLYNQATPNPSYSFDAFAMILDVYGNAITSFKADTCGTCTFKDIDFDRSGNIYVTGSFREFIRFDTTTLYASGYGDVFIAGFRSSGECFLLEQFGGSAFEDAMALDVSDNGKIAVAGTFVGDTMLTHTSTLVNPNSGYSDGYVLLIDSTGTEQFCIHAAGSGEDWMYGVKFLPDGSFWMLDESSSDVTIGSATVTPNLGLAVWLHADSNGNILHYNFADAMMIRARGLDTDPEGHVYVSGQFSGLSISSNGLTESGRGGSTAFWLATDTYGNTIELQTIATGDNINAEDICVNDEHDLLLTGGFKSRGELIIGSDTLRSAFTPGTHFDPWLAKARGVGSTTNIQSVGSINKKATVYPNPVSGDVMEILLSSDMTEATVDLIDLCGRTVYHTNLDGNNRKLLNISRLSPGAYIVHAYDQVNSEKIRVVISK